MAKLNQHIISLFDLVKYLRPTAFTTEAFRASPIVGVVLDLYGFIKKRSKRHPPTRLRKISRYFIRHRRIPNEENMHRFRGGETKEEEAKDN